jgi:NADH:ubiquinone oxidoreductase subunit F (NADH-binding)
MTATTQDRDARRNPRSTVGRLLPSEPAGNYSEHVVRYGPPPANPLGQLVRWADEVGLAGRGGAGFPLSRKLSAVAAGGDGAVVVVNWCEGDPTSVKDLALAEVSPHLVLDGAVTMAGALQARRLIVAAHEGSAILRLVTAAVVERPQAASVEILVVPPRFVASEASSLVSLANDGDARPLGRLAPIWEHGVDGRPTLVANAETAAQLVVLAATGSRSYAAVGDPSEPGTVLITVGGRVARPGAYETATGSRLADVLTAAGATEYGWALVGGLGGGWIEVDRLARSRFTTAALRAAGVPRGVGSITVLGEGCVLAETSRALAYLAEAGAGRCGPCMFGLPAIAGDMAALTAGDRAALDRLHRRFPVILMRGGCAPGRRGGAGPQRGGCSHRPAAPAPRGASEPRRLRRAGRAPAG